MKEKLRRLPDSELAVMQALWRADAPLTRPELDAALTHREWAATTVVALLARLEGKGFIAREKQGRGYLYRALVTQDAYLAAESRTLEEIFLALTKGESDQNDEEEEGKAE